MQGDRQDQSEFTIGRGGERDAGAGGYSPRGASNAHEGERQSGQAEFDLGGTAGPQPESGIPERLRRKYYVAEAGVGDEEKVYADRRGEHLAFKVSTDRMATRLEDAGVVRDMVSVARHRGWQGVELRGSLDFRRTAWLEASVRGLSVRGYEPDPVDRAALAFRAQPETHAPGVWREPQNREAGASEKMTIDGVATRRPIDVTFMPPERSQRSQQENADPGGPTSGRPHARHASTSDAAHAEKQPQRMIDVTPPRAEPPRPFMRTVEPGRAAMFRSGIDRPHETDHVVKTARSQFAAIERALSKAIPDAALRRYVLAHAKERIAQHLERGEEFKHAGVREQTAQRNASPQSIPGRKNEDRSRRHRSHHEH